MALSRNIKTVDEAAFGVNIMPIAAPSITVVNSTTVLGILMDLPWGPYGITEVTSSEDLYNQFAPLEFEDNANWPSLLALVRKDFGGRMLIKRVERTDAGETKASIMLTYTDETPLDVVKVEARYSGAIGNKISVEFTEGTTANDLDMRVKIGTRYDVTYKDVVTGTTVNDPGDRFVVVTKIDDFVAPLDGVALTALAGGATATALQDDWVGAEGTFDGIKAFTAVGALVPTTIFAAEAPEAVRAALNAEGFLVGEELHAVYIPVTDKTATTAAGVLATGTPHVGRFYAPAASILRIRNPFTAAQDEIDVDPNAFLASMISVSSPFKSVGEEEFRTRALQQVTSIRDAFTDAQYQIIMEAGINVFRPADPIPVLHGVGVTTLDDDINGKILNARVLRAVADFCKATGSKYRAKPVDVNIAKKTIGFSMLGLVQAIRQYGVDRLAAGELRSFRVDPFGSTQVEIAAGRFIIKVYVGTFASMDELIIQLAVGQTVDLEVA